MYELKFGNTVPKQMKSLPLSVRERILSACMELQQEPLPHGSVKLEGNPTTHRIRVGEYRILYTVNHIDKVVFILEVGHRKDIYRKRK